MFINIEGTEERNEIFSEVDCSFSYLNVEEAREALGLITCILEASDISDPEQIGIITPYSAQVLPCKNQLFFGREVSRLQQLVEPTCETVFLICFLDSLWVLLV